MHPAKEGFSALPFFDEFDLSTVDVLLISQYVHTLTLLLRICIGLLQETTACGNPRMLEPVSSYLFLPCTYEIFEKPNTIQSHAFKLCSFVSTRSLNSCHLSALRPASLLLAITDADRMVSIVSTSIILPPYHTFSAKPISKAGFL